MSIEKNCSIGFLNDHYKGVYHYKHVIWLEKKLSEKSIKNFKKIAREDTCGENQEVLTKKAS